MAETAQPRRRRRSSKARRLQPLLWALGGALLGALTAKLLDHGQRTIPIDHTRTPAQQYRWTDLPAPGFPIPPQARYLSGLRVVLDPGHVGQRDPGGTWKRGPTGLREAEVNLRVAQFLRQFLEAANAEVRLTRSTDESLDLPDKDDLQQRVELANSWPADLFLSIHHNASADARANYTAVFYHGGPGRSPASLDAARHLAAGLSAALRLETQLPCPVVSDLALHANDGFAVLRLAEVPAVLCEASFHTNPQEEQRLRDPLYNRREAYGLFVGLVGWAYDGLPRVRLLQPADGRVRRGGEVIVELDDGLSARGGLGGDRREIRADSLRVQLGERKVPYAVDWARRRLRVTIPRQQRSATTVLEVDFVNLLGQHVLHPRLVLEISD